MSDNGEWRRPSPFLWTCHVQEETGPTKCKLLEWLGLFYKHSLIRSGTIEVPYLKQIRFWLTVYILQSLKQMEWAVLCASSQRCGCCWVSAHVACCLRKLQMCEWTEQKNDAYGCFPSHTGLGFWAKHPLRFQCLQKLSSLLGEFCLQLRELFIAIAQGKTWFNTCLLYKPSQLIAE